MSEDLNKITEAIIGSAIEVHRELGPGLLESAYEACWQFELLSRGFDVERQKELPVLYKGMLVDCAYRLDLLVENQIIVEIKSVESLAKIHEAQMLSYLKISGKNLGLLVNFNVYQLVKGVKRIVRDLPELRSVFLCVLRG